MKRKSLATDRSLVDKEGGEAAATNQLSEEFILGEFIWFRLQGSSWWPAQVVDENTVSGGNKPSNRSAGEVLVRLYGSYKYIYVDPMKFRSEFENILKQNNGSFSEVLKRTLELDLLRFRSGRSKGKGSKSEEKIKVDASQGKRSKHNVVEKGHEVETPISTNGALVEHKVATSMENASENGASKRRSIMKIDNLTSVRISPRRQPATPTQQTVTKNGSLLSEETAKVKNKKQKQDSPKSQVRISPRRLSTATKPQTVMKGDILLPQKPEAKEKNGYLLLKKAEEARSKSAKNDVVQEKVTPNKPSNNSSGKIARTECTKNESNANSWFDSSFWVSIPPKWTYLREVLLAVINHHKMF
ncbi:uncharacterized protein LOC132279238 isoform X3 [Cornus florida]|uniref:uncharacterized protein LOC132279238 isoform X3 n=1 Tax=Cornus florida TaxID=4283 RepID=UPI00289C7480|nr:uncharacterized protein LOC132279238 isoform X3 [Cornus florida]